MLHTSSKKFYIEKLNGKVHEIRLLSIRGTEEFRETLIEINKEVEKEEYKDKSFSEGYISQPLFRHLVDRMLSLLGLTSEDIDVNSLYTLIFPHELPDGSYERQGKLAKFLLGEIKGGSTVPTEYVNHYAKLISELWCSTKDLKEVMSALDEFDYESFSEVMKYKNEAMKDPEQKMKEDSVAKAKAEFEKITNKGVSNQRFEELTEIENTDGLY